MNRLLFSENRRFYLVGMLFSSLMGGCAFPVIPSSGPVDSSDFTRLKTPNYPKGIAPSGTFSVKVNLQTMPYERLSSLGDGGELLFNPGFGKSYFYVSKGKTKEIRASDFNSWPKLMPDGHVEISSEDYGSDSSRFNSSYPYSLDRSEPCFYNDGSVLIVDAANIPGDRRATYTLYRKWFRPEPEHAKMGDKAVELRSEIVYRAPNPVIFLEKSDTDTVWVQDRHGSEHLGTDQLIRIKDGKQEKVPLPKGYENVQRIAQTKDTVVGTFGIQSGVKPYRNFRKVGHDWKELPIPEGFVMSFVQKVFYDGTILGFVTNSDATKMVSVLWKGDNVAILDEQPNWPKHWGMSMAVLSNRNGLLYVQDGLGRDIVAKRCYLIKVSAKE